MSSRPKSVTRAFRPRARILQLLGDELIGNARLAVFELVKNAYDADANSVEVVLDLRSDQPPTITVSDDGEGMSLETIRDVWLVPGDDHREKQRQKGERSRRHSRLPLGEKGLGRFAVHKLGNEIRLITKARDHEECIVEINWAEMLEQSFLDDAPVRIQEREAEAFKGRKTGTQVRISQLRSDWSRAEVRRLQRQITSICSPFDEPSGFSASLIVLGREKWVEDIPDASEILNRAIWKFTFELRDGRFEWTYQFRKMPGLNLEGRRVRKVEDLALPARRHRGIKEEGVVADASTTAGVGPVRGEFYVFDRDREVLKLLPNVQLVTSYLDENGGIRIYRDGIRVHNYGEPGEDWLGLDLRRVNAPTKGISQNIIIGAIHLELSESSRLVEKTNREGFVENDAADRLRDIVLAALTVLEAERQQDKNRIRTVTAKPGEEDARGIAKPIGDLRKALDRKGIRPAFEPIVARIERGYEEMQSTLLSAGMSGLNLAVVFHEVERGVRALHQVIVDGRDPDAAASHANELMRLLDGFSTLLRKDSRKTHSAKKLVDAIRRFNLLRFSYHKVQLVSPLLDDDEIGFEARFAFSLVVGALNNLIDNSLYWMRVRWPDRPDTGRPSPRKIFLGISEEFDLGPALIVADTGPGFGDFDPQQLAQPFVTRRPSGMGLGLYYSSLAMELNGGMLAFPQKGEVELPEGFDGAVVALVFKKSK